METGLPRDVSTTPWQNTHRLASELYLTAVTTTGSLQVPSVKKHWQCWRREKTDSDSVEWEQKCHKSWEGGALDSDSSTVFSVIISESQEKSSARDWKETR